MKRVRTAAVAALILGLTVLVAGCGEKSEAVTGAAGSSQPFTLMLDWVPNADHVGIYQALADHDFAKAGLVMCFDPTDTIDVSGRCTSAATATSGMFWLRARSNSGS